MRSKNCGRSGFGGSASIVAAGLLIASPAAVAASGAALQGQPPAAVRDLRIGEAVEGELQPGEPSQRRYDDYRLTLGDGEAVQIDLESGVFDAYLELLRPGENEPIDSNDDNGESLNSRLIFTATRGGPYIVRAGRLYSGAGRYRLAVTRIASAPPPVRLVPGQGARGAFDGNSPIVPGADRGRYRYALYDFEAAPGDRVRIDMMSSALDSRLELLGPNGAVIASEDRGGGNPRDARLLAVIGTPGPHLVRASAAGSEPGDFTIELRRGPAVAPGPARSLAPGAAVTEGFDFDAPGESIDERPNQLSYFYRDYVLQVRPGETLTLDLESRDFDPYLEVGVMSPLGFAAARRDDDSGDGLNARLVLRPAGEGPVQVRARTLRPGTGCYTLRVTRGEPPPARPTPPTAPAPAAPPARDPGACAPAR